MGTAELIKQLQEMNSDIEVKFAYNSGDDLRTEVATEIIIIDEVVDEDE